jgi:hypothetical protein
MSVSDAPVAELVSHYLDSAAGDRTTSRLQCGRAPKRLANRLTAQCDVHPQLATVGACAGLVSGRRSGPDGRYSAAEIANGARGSMLPARPQDFLNGSETAFGASEYRLAICMKVCHGGLSGLQSQAGLRRPLSQLRATLDPDRWRYRKDGAPIDPSPWWATNEGEKVRG